MPSELNDGAPHRWIHRLLLAAGFMGAVAAAIFAYSYFYPTSLPSGRPATPRQSSVAASQVACVAKLPDALKLGQKLMISATAETLSSAGQLAAKYNLGGIILMNQASAPAVHEIAAEQLLPPLVATDQEGGTVQRYTSEGALPSAEDQAATMTPAEAEAVAERDDKFLLSQGIDMNLAPVADVAPASDTSVLGSRIFSDNPSTVADYTAADVRAGLAAGVLPTIKHFPGLGSASGNTDDGPATTPSFADLRLRDLIPYERLAGSKTAVMVGNQTVPGLTAGLPASLSRSAIAGELRGKLGYQDNVVITDSLTAKAISENYDLATAVTKAWEAGSDIALIVQVDPATVISSQQIQQILTAAETAIDDGQLSRSQINDSVLRLFALPQKQIDPCHVK